MTKNRPDAQYCIYENGCAGKTVDAKREATNLNHLIAAHTSSAYMASMQSSPVRYYVSYL
jgi:hypothetical protein